MKSLNGLVLEKSKPESIDIFSIRDVGFSGIDFPHQSIDLFLLLVDAKSEIPQSSQLIWWLVGGLVAIFGIFPLILGC